MIVTLAAEHEWKLHDDITGLCPSHLGY